MAKDWDAWAALGIAVCLLVFLLGLGLSNVVSALVALSYRAPDELAAQQSMASAAWAMFYVALAQATLSFGTIVGIALAFYQGRRQARDNRRSAEVQSQAYVHIEKAEWGAEEEIIIWCKNTGSTPATHLSVAVSVYFSSKGSIEDSIQYPEGGHKTWSAFPSGTEWPLSFTLANAEQVRLYRRASENLGDVLVVTGSIIYCTVFNVDHETRFAFYVSDRNRDEFLRAPSSGKAYWKFPGQNGRDIRRKHPSAWDL